MRRRQERHDVGGGFVEAVIVAGVVLRIGHTHDRVDDQVPHLVGDDVEVQCVGIAAAVSMRLGTQLQKAPAGPRIGKVGKVADLQPRHLAAEVPADPLAQIGLPHVEHEARAAIGMGQDEGIGARKQMVEMALR